MKRNDIKSGVVYAKHSWGAPSPVMFLQDKPGLFERQRGTSVPIPRGPDFKPGRSSTYGSTRGYPVLVPAGGLYDGEATWEQRVKILHAIDPAAELARYKKGWHPSVPEVSFDLITSLAGIHGNYQAEQAAYIQAHEDKKRREAEEQQAAKERNAQGKAMQVRLNNLLGIESRWDGRRIVMSLEEAQKVADHVFQFSDEVQDFMRKVL